MARNILVVEDDPQLQELYSTELRTGGYVPIIAKDGKEGLSKILDEDYSLVLLDLMLPVLDGISVLNELKTKMPKDKNVRIVVMTNLSNKEMEAKALSLGALDVLHKTEITPRQLIDKIKVWIQ